ncbi:GLE1-like protein-domain-containing protein [Powellomyces hirtus]|nr:GLE1-like protein-domain-containing protein [Powellomyces hirtus]
MRAFEKTSTSTPLTEVQSKVEWIQSAFGPCLTEADAIDEERRTDLKASGERITNAHLQSITSAIQQIEEKERKEKEAAEAKRKQEEQRLLAAQKAKEEAEQRAKQSEEAAKKQQAADEKALADKAKEAEAQITQARQEAVKASQEAESQKQRDAAAVASANEPSKFIPSKTLEDFNTRVAKIEMIKSKLKPLCAANPAFSQMVFTAKMTFTRKMGQVMNSEKKIIEIARELNQTLKGAQAQGPECYALCMDSLAKKIVKQAESEVAVKMDAAFPIATLCIILYNAHEEFLDILLGRLAKRCPYIITTSFQKRAGEQDTAFRARLGYRKIDDAWESAIQYGERMAGILTVYAAITQTTSIPHKHGVDQAWLWLTRTLNVKPRRIVSLLVLRFIEVAGHELLKAFPKQMEKLLVLLREVFIPMIPPEAVASTTRLQLFLDDVFKTGKIPAPDGKILQP